MEELAARSVKFCQCLLQIMKDPSYVLPERWGKTGQPAMATSEELKMIFETKTANRSRTVGLKELQEELLQLKRTRLQVRGFAAEAATVKVLRQSAVSYKCQAALEDYTNNSRQDSFENQPPISSYELLDVSRLLYSNSPHNSFHFKRHSASSYPS
jgi:hypothetical protein